MRILIIKTSSLGDVIHTLPALTDAGKFIPGISFDWVLEPAFAEIPRFHQLVKKIIPVSLRYWRKNIVKTLKNHEWQNFYAQLREEKYDLVIDAQGLIKSGFLAYLTHGTRCGYDRRSAREPLACLAYEQKYNVDPQLHAITRIRQLFAQALNYPIPESIADYSVSLLPLRDKEPKADEGNYCVFLHGTTRDDKYWPEKHWMKLIELYKSQKLKILLPWGNPSEKERAERLANNQSHVEVLPKLSLTALANLLSHSKINIAVDSGLGHLAAALNAPTISLYGATDPGLIGTMGKNQIHLKADRMENIEPDRVNSYSSARLF